ncbi:MAG: FKBP-type peptidyl-prolyl cis-trans isomerase [Thiogranum sp.]
MSIPVVSKHKVVAVTYSILDESGAILEQSDIPVYYVHGGPNDMFPDVEEALDGCELGESVEVVLPPASAFGEHDASLTFVDDIDKVPAQFRRIGAEVQMQNESGEVRSFFVSNIENGKLTVDGNHPFAGKTLTYALTVADIRDATEEEKQKGVAKPVMH